VGTYVARMSFVTHPDRDFETAWIDGDASARWRSASGHVGSASGSSFLEVPAGCRLPRHTDSAEEVIAVIAGTAEVDVGGEVETVAEGGLALVPKDVPHEVRNAGRGPLRFTALYADTEVVTRYEADVQPDGSRERSPLG
jgi:quercetin dioxygenase-like cupin family protein